MVFYDSAKTSMDIENMVVKILGDCCVSKSPTEAHQHRESDENVYEITVEVKQIWPPL